MTDPQDVDRLLRMAVEHELNEIMDEVDEFLDTVARAQLAEERKGGEETCS